MIDRRSWLDCSITFLQKRRSTGGARYWRRRRNGLAIRTNASCELNHTLLPSYVQLTSCSNQTDIADVLADVMQELNGYGCQQIGAAVFHLQFAVRDIEGKIESKE